MADAALRATAPPLEDYHMKSPEPTATDTEGRVILRMEVSNSEHGYLTTKGDVVRVLRAACSCLVHFPDERNPEGGDTQHLHLNEVSVRGKLPNVIRGFQHVRSLIPFQFYFKVPAAFVRGYCAADSNVMESIAALESVFHIEVTINGKEIAIRGPQEPRTLLGAKSVCNLYNPTEQEKVVAQTICIHPHSQSAMLTLCDGEAWVKKIVAITGTTIHFPSPKGSNGDRQTITIQGTIDGVAAAWLILMSMLPVTLRVFINPDTEYRELDKHLSEELQVNVLVPRRERRPEDRQYVELRSYEGNIENICVAYRCLMGNSNIHTQIRFELCVEKLAKLGLQFAKLAVTEKFPVVPKSRSKPDGSEGYAGQVPPQYPPQTMMGANPYMIPPGFSGYFPGMSAFPGQMPPGPFPGPMNSPYPPWMSGGLPYPPYMVPPMPAYPMDPYFGGYSRYSPEPSMDRFPRPSRRPDRRLSGSVSPQKTAFGLPPQRKNPETNRYYGSSYGDFDSRPKRNSGLLPDLWENGAVGRSLPNMDRFGLWNVDGLGDLMDHPGNLGLDFRKSSLSRRNETYNERNLLRDSEMCTFFLDDQKTNADNDWGFWKAAGDSDSGRQSRRDEFTSSSSSASFDSFEIGMWTNI